MSLMQVHIYAYKLIFLVPDMFSYMNQVLITEVHENCSKCLLVDNVYFIQWKLIIWYFFFNKKFLPRGK